MKKNILVPIDFQIESLNTLKLAIHDHTATEIHATLLYGGLLSNSITDLLFYSQRDIIKSLLNPEFEQAIAILKNRYENTLKSVTIKLLHGNNSDVLNRFLKSNEIDEVFLPKRYTLIQKKGSFDLVPLLQACDLPVFEVEWEHMRSVTNHLDSLFTTRL